MKILQILIICFLVLISSGFIDQSSIQPGMTFEAFRLKLPGIIPDEIKYNENLSYKEKLHDIDGVWSFDFFENKLRSAGFTSSIKIFNQNEFSQWLSNIEKVISDYSLVYGKAVMYEKGSNTFIEHGKSEYQKTIAKKELFYVVIWEFSSTRIKLSSAYNSNDSKQINGSGDDFYPYSFTIAFTPLFENKTVSLDKMGKFYLGMEVKDFASNYPALFPYGVKMNGMWSREEELYGLKGTWRYHFEGDKLSSFGWNRYIQEINKTTYGQCFSATSKLIEDYSKLYGKPDTTIIDNSSYVDPQRAHHLGYDIIEAKWKDIKGQNIKIKYSFLGGKIGYYFLVSINHFDKNDKYFD